MDCCHDIDTFMILLKLYSTQTMILMEFSKFLKMNSKQLRNCTDSIVSSKFFFINVGDKQYYIN